MRDGKRNANGNDTGGWVAEGVYDAGGEQALDLELRDGKMWRDRWYFPGPFEAPEWRAQWVERMEDR